MDRDRIIQTVAGEAPPIIAAHTHGPWFCIAAARVAIDVFRHFGIDAKPMSVRMALFNRTMWDHMERNDGDPGPRDTWPDGAWGLAAGHDPDRMPPDAIVVGPPNGKAWDGHIVAYLPRDHRIVDLSFGQFDRPNRDIPAPPAIAVPVPDDWARGDVTPIWGSEETGVRITATAKPRDRSYTTAPDWRRSGDAVHRRIVGTVIRDVRRIIQTVNELEATS